MHVTWNSQDQAVEEQFYSVRSTLRETGQEGEEESQDVVAGSNSQIAENDNAETSFKLQEEDLSADIPKREHHGIYKHKVLNSRKSQNIRVPVVPVSEQEDHYEGVRQEEQTVEGDVCDIEAEAIVNEQALPHGLFHFKILF